MNIKMSQVRKIIRSILKEDHATASSQLDPREREFSAEHPKWKDVASLKTSTPTEVKAKQIRNIFAQRGVSNDPSKKKLITQELPWWLEQRDPSELMISTAEELADEFASEYL